MGSFIPSGALYKYLLSAPGVPSARPGATGVRRKESRLALPSPLWQSERDRGIQTAVEAAGGVWMVRWSVKAPGGIRQPLRCSVPCTPLGPLRCLSHWSRLSLLLPVPLPRIPSYPDSSATTFIST